MQRVHLSFLGVLSIVISCLGFAMNRSDLEILRPGFWPGPTFHTDRRAAIKMFFNGKIHAADMDNILQDTESKKSVNEEEKCSSCSDDPLRVKRSDGILHIQNPTKFNNTNASKIKESPSMSSGNLKLKSSNMTKPTTSDAIAKSKTSDIIPKTEIADVMTESKPSHVTSELKTSDAIPQSKTANVTSELKNSDVLSESKISHVTKELKTSHVTSQSKTSRVTSESKVSTVPSESKGSDVTSEKRSDSEVLRNVVLLLIDHSDSNEEATWKNLGAAYEFPIQGSLQNCRRSKPSEDVKFSLGESSLVGRRDECECNRILRANIGSLLSWAHHVKNMTTGAVSATNFSIPSPFGYKNLPSQSAKDLEDEVNSPNQDALRTHIDLNTNWRLVELQRESNPSSSTPIVVVDSATKVDPVNGFDGIWDVFDMFSRIRMAFFRILLDSFGNSNGFSDELFGRRPLIVQPNVVELVGDTIRELKSLPNENGFLMVVAAPGNETSAIFEVLQREVTSDNTLLIIAGMCSANDGPVRFFASGPGRKSLHEGLPIWDLPGSIKDAISKDCHGRMCKNELLEESLSPSSLELLSFSNDNPRKRIARAKEEDETALTIEDDKTTTKDAEDVENNSDEKTTVPETEKRSGADISRVDNVAAILGIGTSITAMLALIS